MVGSLLANLRTLHAGNFGVGYPARKQREVTDSKERLKRIYRSIEDGIGDPPAPICRSPEGPKGQPGGF